MKVDQVQLTACHWALLRLAGAAPDDLLTQCRQWLAQGRVVDVARAIAHAAASHRVGFAPDEIEVLSGLLVNAGDERPRLPAESAGADDDHPGYGFAASRALMELNPKGSEQVTASALAAAASPEDVIDTAALTAASAEPDVLAVWRAWRFPPASPFPPPQRVFVVETGREADLCAVTGRIQEALAFAGETKPQVESYPIHADLPEYQQYARLGGGLIWARTPDPGVQIAAVFDSFDEAGDPFFAPDHPRLDQPDAELVMRYLNLGQELLLSAAAVPDVVDPARGSVVPMGLRTDGFWIWSDASVHYLRQYGLMPDAGLVGHIRRRKFAPPVVDGAAIYRSLMSLQAYGADEPSAGDGAHGPRALGNS